MKIHFGKPLPGIDGTSLKDGIASGLVNGFLNEVGDTESIPGVALRTTLGTDASVHTLYETLGGVVLAVSAGQIFIINADGSMTPFTGEILTPDAYCYFAEDGQQGGKHVYAAHGEKLAELDMRELTVRFLNQNSPSHATHLCRSKGDLLCNGDDFLATSSIFDLAQVYDNSASLFGVVVLHDKPGWIVAAAQGTFSVDDNAGRLYHSQDNGVTWTRIFSTPTIDNQFLGLEYMGNGVVLAGTAYSTGHMFRSTDYGLTWTDLGQLGSSLNINFIKKITDTIVIAGAGGSTPGNPIPGLAKLWRSTDVGATWTDVGPDFGLDVTAGEALSLDGSVVAIAVLSGTNEVRVWRSIDYGVSFSATIPTEFSGAGYMGFIQRVNDTIAIAPNGWVNGVQKIWRTVDQGLNWVEIGPIPGFSEHAMVWACCKLADGSLLIGTSGDAIGVGGAQIWKSVDDGLTWHLLTVLEDFRLAAVQWGGLKETHITNTVIAVGRVDEGRDGKATAAKWQTAIGVHTPVGDCFYSNGWGGGYENVDSWERFNAESVPDAVTGVFSHRGLVYAGGPRSIEINYSSGDAEFPWAVSDPSLPFGLLAPNSWVSWDEEDEIMYLSSTDKAAKVVHLKGRTQQGISPEYDQILNDRNIITRPQDAKAWGITIRGLRFYVITFQADNLTLIYNLTQDHWARWAYWNGTSYEAALINSYCYSTAHQRHYFGDRRATGKVFTMELTDLTDDGTPILFEYTSGNVSRGKDDAKFPARYLGRYKRGFSVDSTVPEVLLSWRDDGRATFNTERVLSLGATGDNEYYVHANRLGMYRTRQWRQRAFLSKCRLIFSGADES